MSAAAVQRFDLYPVPAEGAGIRISPTIISQFVRLNQCRRYLRLALHHRALGARFMNDYDVTPQEIQPLLTRAGAEFEAHVETSAAVRLTTRNLAKTQSASERQPDNVEVVQAARDLPPNQVIVLFQPRLRVALNGWDFTGDADIVRLERDGSGVLHALVADMKSTRTAKVEHRLQVAFYCEMLERLFAESEVAHAGIATAVLYRGVASIDDDLEPVERDRIAGAAPCSSSPTGSTR